MENENLAIRLKDGTATKNSSGLRFILLHRSILIWIAKTREIYGVSGAVSV